MNWLSAWFGKVSWTVLVVRIHGSWHHSMIWNRYPNLLLPTVLSLWRTCARLASMASEQFRIHLNSHGTVQVLRQRLPGTVITSRRHVALVSFQRTCGDRLLCGINIRHGVLFGGHTAKQGQRVANVWSVDAPVRCVSG
jgi:hypothetical protein